MNNDIDSITLEQVDNETVVDSRLLAQALNVDHGDWLQNIVKKYQAQIEQGFGSLRFKNDIIKRDIGATTVRYCYLTEDQSFFVLTLSRNTPIVVELKAKLVKAFSEARAKNDPLKGKSAAELLLIHAQFAVELENRQKALENNVKQIESQLSTIVADKAAAKKELSLFPLPTEKPNELSERSQINWLVRQFADLHKIDHKIIWNALYKQLYYRYSYNVKVRAQNEGRKSLDQCEKDNQMHNLYLIACEMFSRDIQQIK